MYEVSQPQPVRVSLPDLPQGYHEGAGGLLRVRALTFCRVPNLLSADFRGRTVSGLRRRFDDTLREPALRRASIFRPDKMHRLR